MNSGILKKNGLSDESTRIFTCGVAVFDFYGSAAFCSKNF